MHFLIKLNLSKSDLSVGKDETLSRIYRRHGRTDL